MARVCVLSLEEVGRLAHYNKWPDCRHHRHVSSGEAVSLILDHTHYVPDPRLVTAITRSTSADYQWRNRPSGGRLGLKVRQLVAV